MTACDACPDFGFGVSCVECSDRVARQVGRLAERHGDFIRLYRRPDDPLEKDRLGVPHRLPFCQDDFRVVISKRARWAAHSGILEAHGLLLAVKWLSRTPQHHGHRVPILVDAKAVLGAAAKGAQFGSWIARHAAAFSSNHDGVQTSCFTWSTYLVNQIQLTSRPAGSGLGDGCESM